MDKEHIKGAIDTMVGKAKEAAGHVTGNTALEAEGKLDQIKGSVHNTAGDIKDVGKDAIHRVSSAIDNK